MKKLSLAKVSRVLLRINYVLTAVALSLCAFYGCRAHAKDIKVMVIDTGIGEHKLLNSYVQYDSSDNYEDGIGHGTHVTGIILFGNHNRDPERFILDPVCHNVKIYSCKYMMPKPFWGFGGEELLAGHMEIDCIKKATRMGINIINFSGGGPSYNTKEYEAIKEFTEKGGWFVTAAGNDNHDLQTSPYYPASYGLGFKEKQKIKKVYENKRVGTKITMTADAMVDKFVKLKHIVVVSSVERNGKLSRTSNRDPAALKELGVDIISTLPNNKFGSNSGTSMAAPAFLHKLLIFQCKKLEERNAYHSTHHSN